MSSSTRPELSFAELDLPQFLQDTLSKVGYEKPSPIQQATIPVLLQGKDVVGMAQTGTGKTAAFALPILAKIDLTQARTQALVLCPTRELAIQVAEAFQTYAAGMRGFHVLPIYGGQEMGRQLTGLRRGAHVVVGTPGRLLDHLNRKTIDLSQLNTLVLDEADEMLRMGFIDDVEAILENTPKTRQVALFSATMPAPIRAVAEKYLTDPQEIRIQSAISTNEDIEQFYWLVQGTSKLDALTRILEVEEFDAMLIFVRTKTSTVDLAEKLSARGFAASPLNGDMNQAIRTRTVEQLKNGQLDILVATDVAARGLDVDRLSHVMNYDIPYDDEAYVHRIGRTGRAGRSGKAILFVAPRERRLLQSIEKTTRKKITQMELPTRGELIEKRSNAFKEGIADTIRDAKLDFFHKLVSDLVREHECTPEHVAAAMAYLLQKDRPLEPATGGDMPRSDREGFSYGEPRGRSESTPRRPREDSAPRAERSASSTATRSFEERAPAPRAERAPRPAAPPVDDEFEDDLRPAKRSNAERVPTDTLFEQILAEEVPEFEERPRRAPREEREPREHVQRHNPAEDGKARPLRDYPDISMERFRIHVGHKDGVTPREVLGAIANEAEIEGRYIGHIRIYDDYSTVDLPSGMPKEVMQILQKTHVCRKPLMIEPVTKPFAAPGHYARDAAAAPKPSYEKPAYDKPAYEKPAFKKEGFKKEGFKRDGFEKPAFRKDGFEKPAFKKDGFEKPAFKKEGFKKDGFSKPAFNKDGAKPEGFVKPAFKKDGYEKPAFKKDGFEKPAFKKEGFEKPAFKKDGDTKPAFHNVESKDITREVLERFPDLEAPGIRKAPRPVLKANPDAVGADKPVRVKAPGAKVKPKSKRVDKDKGKRRTPIPPKAE
jgi:ATP-dependent RNA helicase DeaD